MKRLYIAMLAFSLTLGVKAQTDVLDEMFKTERPQTKQQQMKIKKGEVPVVDGKVTFTQTFDAKGKSKAELYALIGYYCEKRFAPSTSRGEWDDSNFFKNLEFSRVLSGDRREGTIKCQGAEELVFKKSFLVYNWSEVYYKLLFEIEDEKVKMTINNIYYIYKGGGVENERYYAEDWITDENVVNKKGNILKRPYNFRSSTLKMVTKLANEIKVITSKKTEK